MRYKYFLPALFFVFLLPFVVSAKGWAVRGEGVIRHEPCVDEAIEILKEFYDYTGPKPEYCIYMDIDEEDGWYPFYERGVYFTIPGRFPKLDAFRDGEKAYFQFGVIAWGDRYNTPDRDLSVFSLTPAPQAHFEDPVLTDIASYRPPLDDIDLETLEGKAAAELYRRTIIQGYEYASEKYSGNRFWGSRAVNRAEAAKFLLRTKFGDVEQEDLADLLEGNRKFPDVLLSQWYVKYIAKATQEGIIHGYPNGLFRPENSVNTVEFLKMLTNTFELQENLTYSYRDVGQNAWYLKYAGVAERYELFPERDPRYLKPNQILSRDEVAVAIYQYLKNRERQSL